MINEILKIRIKQAYRIFFQIGILRALFLFSFIALVFSILFIEFAENHFHELFLGISIFSFLIILSIHIKRKDKTFINIYSKEAYQIFFIEYLIISIVLIITLIFNQFWIYTLLYILSLILVSFFKVSIKKNSINSIFQKIIPNGNFEWKAGIRKYLILFVGIWIIGFTSSFFIGSVPITIFILGVFVLTFYEKSESLQILISEELSPNKFLINKLKKHLSAFSILITPLILSFVIFNPEFYYIPLIEFLIFLILLIYTILLKYAFYSPNLKSGASQIYVTIGVMSLFMPVFIPVILLLLVKFYLKANNNLKFYMNDFN